MKTLTLKTLNESLDKHLNDTDWGILGSCQYETIGATYNWALEHIKKDRAKFESLLDISYTKILSPDNFQKDLFSIYSLLLKDIQKELDTNTQNYDKEDLNDIQEIINLYPNKTMTIEQYYEHEKDMASDLWSSYINPLYGFKIGIKLDTPTMGPLWNQILQTDNFEIGIALAYTTLLYNTDIETFSGFDT